jgi:hypothetical protein
VRFGIFLSWFPHLKNGAAMHFTRGHKFNSHAPASMDGQQPPKSFQSQIPPVDLNNISPSLAI